MGYTDTTVLHNDMLHDALNVTEFQDEYPYVLCPFTTFDFGTVVDDNFTQVVTPLIPIMSNTSFYCGSDGAVQNECILTGGVNHVIYFDQFLLSGILFRGLTFTKSGDGTVMATGNPYSNAFFVDCEFMANEGAAVIFIQYDGAPGKGRRLHDEPKFREYLLPFDESVYGMIPRSEPQDVSYSNDLPRRLAQELGIAAFDEDSIYGVKEYRERHEGRNLQGYPVGMPVYLVGCRFEDNFQRYAVILNVAGLVQIINSNFEDNQSSQLATVTVLYGGALAMHENTHFKSNFDQIGPVFIDKYSHLILNEEVTGLTNLGGNKGACDILLEDFESECLNTTVNSCVGTCCSFGDTSCDYVTDEPTSPPQETSEGSEEEGSGSISITFAPKKIAPTEAPVYVDNALQSARTQSDSVGGCGSGCVATATIVPLIVIAFVAMIFYKRRTGIDRNPGSSNSVEMTSERNTQAVDA
eukprot:CAMPEP_0172485250 /NCGR_PEP_ID=MMETSP1066-20121228/13202_1 /TAXON_ID=671091 /ORGANISM="Coscinodiscus wailesii, Strain CCMP2513" /LENGTH=467 /DNA_ID=CAMNT_0013250377 /DNA_START=207 /DNA_END=1610 /DNA_ORIENTATION=+